MAPKEAAKAKAKAKAEKKPQEEEKPRMEKPDRAALDEAVQKIQEDIDKLKGKQQALSEKINSKRGGNDVFQAKRTELINQRNEFSDKIDALMKQKDGINGQIQAKKSEGVEMKNELNKMKKSIGFTSEAEIDERIANIEFKLWTESHALKDEKKYLEEIKQLKRNRPKVAQVNKMEQDVKGFDPGLSMKDNIQAVNAEISALRDGRRKIQEALTELIEGRNAQMGDLGPVIAEKEEISKKIQEKVQERNTLRDEFRAKEQEFRKYMDEVRAERQRQAIEQREARNKEYDLIRRQRAADKLDEQPHIAEMTLIEQTMLFCKSLIEKKGGEEKVEKKETTYDNPDGYEVVLKKEDREEEYFFAPTAKGKKGKKGKAPGGGKAEGSGKPIKHNAETFRLFDQLKLDAPITTDEIPALLEKLEAQLEEYKAKVKVWEEKREEMKKKILEEGFNPEEEEKKEEESKEEKAEE